MKDFTAKYGIKITDANPEGSSQDELNAIKQLKGQSRAPDVVDVGSSFAAQGPAAGDWAPYEVATWNDIPAAAKEPTGDYYADYGGYVAIGYDTSKVKNPPTSFKSLLTGSYKNEVAIDGNPNQTGVGVRGGLRRGAGQRRLVRPTSPPASSYFKNLKQAGNFVPVEGTPATVQSGQTPILIWWDYLLASEVAAGRQELQDRHPVGRRSTPATTTRRSARPRPTPPPPGCGRSTCTRPRARTSSSRARPGRSSWPRWSRRARSTRPPPPRCRAVPGSTSLSLPTIAQQTTAATVVAQQWPSVSG